MTWEGDKNNKFKLLVILYNLYFGIAGPLVDGGAATPG